MAKKQDAMSRDQVIDAMRFLGYVTHDERGNLFDQAYHTAAALAGRVGEDVMLGVWIAQEWARHGTAPLSITKGESS